MPQKNAYFHCKTNKILELHLSTKLNMTCGLWPQQNKMKWDKAHLINPTGKGLKILRQYAYK